MAILLMVPFLCFALYWVLRPHAEKWGPVRPLPRPIKAARQPLRPTRPSFEQPEPQPGTNWFLFLYGTQSNQTIQLNSTHHGHTPDCSHSHSGSSGFDASSCGGHSSHSHGL